MKNLTLAPWEKSIGFLSLDSHKQGHEPVLIRYRKRCFLGILLNKLLKHKP
jgi:hypothetical protein